jgi:hypothetical protein
MGNYEENYQVDFEVRGNWEKYMPLEWISKGDNFLVMRCLGESRIYSFSGRPYGKVFLCVHWKSFFHFIQTP